MATPLQTFGLTDTVPPAHPRPPRTARPADGPTMGAPNTSPFTVTAPAGAPHGGHVRRCRGGTPLRGPRSEVSSDARPRRDDSGVSAGQCPTREIARDCSERAMASGFDNSKFDTEPCQNKCVRAVTSHYAACRASTVRSHPGARSHCH
jgi:hypothetical protein